MDDIVKQAIAKWPNVPVAYGWLGLDRRGQWYLRNSGTQALGGFASGIPDAKGSLIEHAKLIEFIERNYESDAEGQWFFQNGPQRAYVELEAAPLIWRIESDLACSATLVSHAGRRAQARTCVVDEAGLLYFDSDAGFGLLHSLDVAQAADAIERGTFAPMEVPAHSLPSRFGFVPSPAARQADSLSEQ